MAWSGTPIVAAGTVPLLSSSGAAVNSAANYRQGFIGALVAPAPGGPMVWRGGVLPTASPSGATDAVDMVVAPTSTASSSILIGAGNCVIPRAGAAGGPYLACFPSVSTLVTDPADSTNPRIDAVVVQLVDNALGDTGNQGGQLLIVNGAPAAQPAAPAVPTGAIPLATILRPANTTTVPAANVTDTRKSTSTLGGVRCLLPGDASADPGSYIGELTYDSVTSLKSGFRWWDGTTWRGVGSKVVPSYTRAITTNATLSAPNHYAPLNTSWSDPGYPYYISIAANYGGSNMVSPSQVITNLRLDNTSSGPIISEAWATTGSSSVWTTSHAPIIYGPLTGAHSAGMELFFAGGGQSAVTSANAQTGWLGVTLIPT